MVFNWLLPVIFALLTGVIYYFSNRFDVKHKPYHYKFMSFSAGVSITYVLLELFPTFTDSVSGQSQFLFLSVPIGFIFHHLIEKYIYQHNNKHELIKSLTFEENIFSFVYHIILGVLLVLFTRENIVRGILFFVPVVSYTFVSTLPTNPHVSKKKTILLAASTLIGVLFSIFFFSSPPQWASSVLIGLTLGVLLFTVIRHHIPFGGKGHISFFTLGFLIYSVFIVGSWYLV